MPYIAFVLDTKSRAHLLKTVPTSFSRVVAHHVTLVGPREYQPDSRARQMTQVIATTLHIGDDIEAIGVKFDNDTTSSNFTHRRDGSYYHVTLSHEATARPVKSNTLKDKFIVLPTPIVLTGKVEICE
jgi:hypothetical protein